jgi:hypothetical protein
MRFQGGGIVAALVTEHLPEGSVPHTIPDEPLPIVVADLVAEMPEERAVRLRHVAAMAFAFGVVGLGDVDGDQAAGMTRDDLRAFLEHRARAGEEVEGEPLFGVLGLAHQRQAEAHESVDEAVLGGLQALPEQKVFGRIEVRYRPVEATSAAEGVRAVGGHQPVAGAVDGIGAEAEWFIGGGQWTPAVAALGRQSAERRSIGQIAQNVSATLAPRVLEVEQLAAVLALEQLHAALLRAHSRISRCMQSHRVEKIISGKTAGGLRWTAPRPAQLRRSDNYSSMIAVVIRGINQ